MYLQVSSTLSFTMLFSTAISIPPADTAILQIPRWSFWT